MFFAGMLAISSVDTRKFLHVVSTNEFKIVPQCGYKCPRCTVCGHIPLPFPPRFERRLFVPFLEVQTQSY